MAEVVTRMKKRVVEMAVMAACSQSPTKSEKDIAEATEHELGAERRRKLHGQLVVWGYVKAYRASGGTGYPASLNGGNGGDQSNFGLPDMGTAFCNIEMCLKDTAPIIQFILFFQYAKPFAADEQEAKAQKQRNIQADAEAMLTSDPEQAVAMVEEAAKPQEEVRATVGTLDEFISYAYGDVPLEHVKALARVMGAIRREWVKRACKELFG